MPVNVYWANHKSGGRVDKMKHPVYKILGIVALTGILSACGKVGNIKPPAGLQAVENTYPAPSCLDKIKDIKDAHKCPKP